ncbi:MAG TPA: hypothetical protein VG298_03010 [Acidimicrobiales bacterium]|jgi:hypothetical protein|nr:hypothetical protein [Acidimicrobiales bacterium]
MPPLIPRRRSRRRSVSGRLVVLICALILTALVIGGLTQVSRQSGPYDAMVNRSLAAQGGVVAQQSNATAIEVRHLMATMESQDRQMVQSELDSVVQQTADQSSRADVLGTAAGGWQAELDGVFADRAQAASALRAAIDGLLGMHPLPLAGAPAQGATGSATPTLLSASEATNRIAAAGALLTRSDRSYQSVRRALARAAGHGKLPPSSWVAQAQAWQIGAVATQVDLVSTSTSLAATHRLVLTTVGLTPQALPPPSGAVSPAISILSPTRTLTVSVVLANLGSVDQRHASVQFTLAPLAGGATVTKTRSATVTSGGSVVLTPVTLAVKPGQSYQLTVGIILPAGQTDGTNTSLSQQLQIAPSK